MFNGPYGLGLRITQLWKRRRLAAVGALALLAGEANGFASDFTTEELADMVAKVVAGVETEYANPDAWYSNGGTSPKQIYNSTGTLVWSPHNMLLQSQTLDNGSWSKTSATVTADQDGTADKIVEAAATASHYAQSAATAVIAGAIYTFEVSAKPAGRNLIVLELAGSFAASTFAYFNVATGVVGTIGAGAPTAAISADTEGYYKARVTAVASATGNVSPRIYTIAVDGTASYAGDGSSGVLVKTTQFNRGTVPTAYLATTTAARYGLAIDHDPVTLARKGLLAEPAATNLLLQASNFANSSWAKGVTVTSSAIAAPNGRTEADLLTPGGSTSHAVYQAVTLTVATGFRQSFFLKNTGSSTRSRIGLYDVTAAAFSGTLDVAWSNGTPSQHSVAGNATGAVFQQLSNGWWRVSISVTTDAVNTSYRHYFYPDVVAGTGGIYVWGAQLETGSVATSPIPTFAATLTRTQDQPFVLTSAFPLGTAWTTFVELLLPAFGPGATQYIFAYHDSSGNELAGLRTNSTGAVTIGVVDGGVTQSTQGGVGSMTAGVISKVTARYALENFNLSRDGGAAPAPDTTGTMPTVTRLEFRSHNGGTGVTTPIYIRKIVHVPRAVNDNDLPTRWYEAA